MKQAKRIVALLLALVMVVGMLPTVFAVDGAPEQSAQPEWPNEGSINLNKDALAVEGKTDQWEVTLTIEGKNYKTTSDVVLVIDNSNSMWNTSTRIQNTKMAAKTFAAKLLTEGSTTRIAVVVYCLDGHGDSTDFYTYETLAQFNSYIDGIQQNNTYGGTNTQWGLHEADRILSSEASTGTLKNIVLLSDGMPTQSYQFTATARKTGCRILDIPFVGEVHNDWDAELTDITYTGFDYSTPVGDGYENEYNSVQNNVAVSWTCEHGESGTETMTYGGGSYTNHSYPTIEEARLIKAKGTTIYSIALQAGTIGEDVLQACATDTSRYYFEIGANDNVETELASAFTSIAGSLAIAASQGTVYDPMGEDVDLLISADAAVYTNNIDEYTAGNADIYISQGTLTYDAADDAITWNVGNVNEGDVVTMRYKVTLADGVNPETGTAIPTNKETTFTYLNYQQQQTTGNFPIPRVTIDGGTILKHYYLVNANGQPINSAGVVVDRPELAMEIQDPAYVQNDEGGNGLKYGTHTVSYDSIEGYDYYGYVLNDEALVPDRQSVQVDLQASHSSQHVWFAYSQYFTVVHSSDSISQTFPVPAAGDTFDLTGVVYDGYLYGGYRHNDSNGDFGTESGLTLTPEAGDVYYLKEVDDAYLQPKILHVYNWYYGYKVTQVHMVTAIDDTNYQHVGFIVGGENSAEAVKSDDTVYEKIDVDYADGRHVEKNLDDFFSDLQGNGLLHMQRYSGEIAANGSFAFTPFFVTMDSVRVTGTETRTVSFGDGTFHNDGSTGGLSVSDAPNDFKPELYTSSAAANSLTLLSSYAVSWDEAPAATQYTVTKVDGGSTATQTVEPGDQTGQITYAGQSGKVFAGWFTDSACTLPADFSNVQGDVTVYAKYVDAPSTGVSVQSKRGGATTLKTTVTLDTDQFAQVGFAYDCNGDTGTAVAGEKTEKRSLMGWFFGQGNTTYQYSGSWSTGNLGFMDSFTITPYWVTLDGTTVYGEAESYLSLGALILRK